MALFSPPATEEELYSRVRDLAGKNLTELAGEANWELPADLKREKGWIGQLIERLLGANAGNLSEPDFQALGIELKTIPLNSRLQAKESTYVCAVPLLDNIGLQWQHSCVYKKLQRVLWIPIESNPDIAPLQRKVGRGFIWSPDFELLDTLQSDWEELMELISLGEVDSITAHKGKYLQIRPKAANASVVTTGIGINGLRKQTLPRGFYLRTLFTNHILKQQFG
jgi:DNA mismatch repair protein MutH